MEKLEQKKEKFERSLAALDRNIRQLTENTQQPPLYSQEILVASAVKHLELCYEMSWKFLQQYLETVYDVKLDSPKKIFRECFSRGIFDDETTRIFLQISDARNATTHDYNQEAAGETIRRINGYQATFNKLVQLVSGKVRAD